MPTSGQSRPSTATTQHLRARCRDDRQYGCTAETRLHGLVETCRPAIPVAFGTLAKAPTSHIAAKQWFLHDRGALRDAPDEIAEVHDRSPGLPLTRSARTPRRSDARPPTLC
jgi:hypothetical protein